MGMKTFALKQPIALQLACIGSQSIIYYGMSTTIEFSCETYEEYFDIANMKYYDAILGTPFLRRLGVTLSSPGLVGIGNKKVPIGSSLGQQIVERRPMTTGEKHYPGVMTHPG
jgi:hypothetical protein